MNENNYRVSNDIGIDPSSVPVIDTLDAVPSEETIKANKPQKPKKKNDLVKKILFTVLVILLMAGVGFGVYYYLSLGAKNNPPKPAEFTLQNQVVYVGDSLSTDLVEYGDFSKVDISACSLDIQGVDMTKEGQYDYSVMCNSTKYSAKITVLSKVEFTYQTKLVRKVAGSSYDITDFISGEGDYDYEFIENSAVINYFKNAGGPYNIGITLKDNNGNTFNAYAALVVTHESPYITMNCRKKTSNITEVNTYSFNSSKNDMGYTTKSFEYKYEDKKTYDKEKQKIVNGMLTMDDHTGIAIVDDNNLTITIVAELDKNNVPNELSNLNSYNDIYNYYSNNGYVCKI